MDFMQRGGQTRTNGVTRHAAGAGAVDTGDRGDEAQAPNGGKRNLLRGRRGGLLGLLAVGLLVAIALVFFFIAGKGGTAESKIVDKNAYQAVFINVNGTNGGQVYFGKIDQLTSQFIRLRDVFYIQNQQNAQNQQNNSAYNLVKLGCELHGPEDEMVINRSEVFFWENLKTDSQVVQKVEEWHKQNPGGQKCTTANQQQNSAAPTGETNGNAGQSTGQPTQGSTNTQNTNTSPTTNTPTR